ncbi:hypothetical protein ACLB1E_23145 [Escherichia coli]
MEQLTATVKQNADNAHYASKLAQEASISSQRWRADGFRCSKNDGRYLHEFEENF